MSFSQAKSEEFFAAATEGNLALLRELSQDPEVDVNIRVGDDGDTPLIQACRGTDTEIIRFLLGLSDLDPNVARNFGDTPFAVACSREKDDVISLLLADERIDVNQGDCYGNTPFGEACSYGRLHVVSLLLGDPRVELNKVNDYMDSPLSRACEKGQVEVVGMLLEDSRIVVDPPNSLRGTSPLLAAAMNGHLLIIKLWLASNREAVLIPGARYIAEQVRERGDRPKRFFEPDEMYQRTSVNCPLIADLIEEYEQSPDLVRMRLRRELHLDEPLAGDLFSLVVYLSDGFFRIPDALNDLDPEGKAVRFFSMAALLPMELQMVVCNRAFGLPHQIIKRAQSEPGFMKFARF